MATNVSMNQIIFQNQPILLPVMKFFSNPRGKQRLQTSVQHGKA